MNGSSEQACGYVYILTNVLLPGLVKIGATTTSVQQRAAEINAATGVPGPFEIFAFFESREPFALEYAAHKKLAKFRCGPRKEFFNIPPETAHEFIKDLLTEVEHAPRSIEGYEFYRLNDVIDLGIAIRERRRALSLTQEQVAGMAGVGRRCMLEVEKGKSTAQIGAALKIMAALELALHVPRKLVAKQT